MSQKTTTLFLSLLILVSGGMLVRIALPESGAQWDFRVYYDAARVYSQGADPYAAVTAPPSASSERQLPFLYPPLTLALFVPFGALPFSLAYTLWLALKLALLGLLIYIWRDTLEAEPAWQVYLFFLMAFGSVLYLDLKTGNVSLFEVTLLWSSFWFLKQRRTLLFCVLLVCASLFRWTPIFFLLLLPLLQVERWRRYVAMSILGLGAWIAANYLSGPERFFKFLKAALAHDERGALFNTSTLAFWRDACDFAADLGITAAAQSILPYLLYAASVIVVLALSTRALRYLETFSEAEKRILYIYLACLVYALVAPRLKVYSFALLIPAAFHTSKYLAPRRLFGLLFILLAYSPFPAFPLGRYLATEIWYYPLGVLSGLWLFWLWRYPSPVRPHDQ